MPATEQTWRDQKKLHFLFAITGTILFVATVWMFLKDHNREWKQYQSDARNIQVTADKWRETAVQTVDSEREHERLQTELLSARATPVPEALYNEFKERVNEDVASREGESGAKEADFAKLDQIQKEAAELGATAVTERQKATELTATAAKLEATATTALVEKDNADRAVKAAATPEAKTTAQSELDAKTKAFDDATAAANAARKEANEANGTALAAEQAAAQVRGDLVERLTAYVKSAKFREDNLLGTRKFANANLDKAKADEGLVIRDYSDPDKKDILDAKLAEKESVIHEIDAKVADLTLQYQAAAAHRKALQSLLKQITANEDKIKKDLEANRADLVRIEKAIEDRRATYVVWWGAIPTPGKKLLEAPILDAFNSPLKIENLWSEGLTIDYNFRDVKRYDRCTTCHQMMEKSQPGAADKPGYVKERLLTLILTPPTPERYAELKKQADDAGKPLTVEDVFGVAIGGSGLADRNAVSVTNVLQGSLATQARLKLNEEATTPVTGDAARDAFLKVAHADDQPYELDDPANPFAATPGLNVGDVFVDVDGSLVRSNSEAERFLLEGARSQKPLHLLVRRGLKNPFTSHPRLDLFIGSLSPHKMQEFACTICHEGQGSATAFKWASHTPNTVDQAKRWSREHGWFDNHHWIYPMNAKRFAESSCLKCHHDVVDLEPSERFAETPAPKVVHGYNLIRKYGCYGCHEMNGYDGPNKRIGPDLRLEPNYFAAAQQLKADPNFDKLTSEEKGWVDTVIANPEREAERTRLYELLLSETAEDSRLTAESRNLAPLFKNVEAAGSLRKVGPSLRFADTKLDEAFLFDWINNPKNFRPSTRMPRVFGLHDHLDGHSLEVAQKYEPIEIQGISTYLQANSQKFEYLDPPSEVNAAPSAERGKVQFQTRGCLACHSHGEFAEAEEYRGAHEIVQGPDLSGLAKKFDPQRNPKGRQWLYSWIKEPTRYHARTVMPDLYLDPIEVTVDGKTEVTDPVADIVEYLMTSTAGAEDWRPADAQPGQLDNQEQENLHDLMLEHLKDAFAVRTAEQYAKTGIPASRKDELKGAERDLILADGQKELTDEQKLTYIGRKSISKYGCYGCHDIPGFEDAKPIGAGLNDWGRKEPAKLAFEHIVQYLEHGHGHAGHGSHPGKSDSSAEEKRAGNEDSSAEKSKAEEEEHAKEVAKTVDEGKLPGEHAAHGHKAGEHPEEAEYPDYFLEQIFHGNRIGFLYQKLREPRSYDYKKTENKKYNDRLRMPLFPFNDEDREAVMTFVLGMVADPPAEKYVYRPNARNTAIIEGQKVLEKYNCQGCHILEMEKWTLSLPKDGLGEQMSADDIQKVYPFLLPHVSPEAQAASMKTDRRGMNRKTLAVMPRVDPDGRPSVNDEEGEALDPEGKYDPSKLTVYFDLWEPAVIAGQSFMVGIKPMNAPVSQIEERHAPHGGFLTRYLIPVVTKLDAAESGAQKGPEAMAWLPPPLVGEGQKVQSEWLHEFLLEPYPIRPAVFLRMPKFNMSRDEATKLAAYFAAVDNADYPYAFTDRRQSTFLDQAEAEYQSRTARVENEEQKPAGSRLDGAMRIVTSNDYCVKCHIVGNYVPGMNQPTKPSARALAPDLSRVYNRFRPDYLREWIANPKTKLPYTAMPVNIPYDSAAPHLGGVSQDLYHGTSVEQLDALVDLLMNFDTYSKGKTDVAGQVKPAATEPAEQPAAAEASSGE